MTTLLDQYNLATDPMFNNKIRMAAVQTALEVQAEDRLKGFDTYHDKRASLASTVLGTSAKTMVGGIGMVSDSDAIVQRFAYAVASDPNIDAPSPDSDLQASVENNWDSLAGVTDNEKPEVVPPS
jgi:hypothetical protein